MRKLAVKGFVVGLCALSIPVFAQAAPKGAGVNAGAPAQIVREKMEGWVKDGKALGAAAALYIDGRAEVISVGRRSKDKDAAAVDAHTLYSIGSITKVFTATMLAHLINEGKLKPTEAVDKYLPSYTHLRPAVRGKLTFERLATFTASLPDGAPAKIKTAEQYFGKYLSHWRPRWPIGSRDKYSDQSYEILAYLVPRIAKTDYPAMLSSLITKPLDMPDTLSIHSSNPDKDRAEGYNARGEKFSFHKDSWNGVGFLMSTPTDMLNFLQACVGAKPGSDELQRALKLTWRPYFKINNSSEQGFAWVVHSVSTAHGKRTLISKNGAIGGYFALMVFDPEAKSGVVFLTSRDSQKSKHPPQAFALAKRILTGG
ncbi:MAG: serine hydrolase domain-containing protein [Gammaproteobacteria bacterium]